MTGRTHNPGNRRGWRRTQREADQSDLVRTPLRFMPRVAMPPFAEADALRRRCGVPSADECRAELEQAHRVISLAGHGLAFPPGSAEAQLLDDFAYNAAVMGEP